ncbi:Nsp1-like C-terminal region-domain-containing protein [Hypoxylon rubiginosum]|uniref:Nsp1-like C-terminal region-domain-containing protein n=1 Tax=Hypoxylon rubiginosum TaxID=110542 RepID=A0ACC0DMD0_9PEZI|nr:Nsp1-like C-terminal region-domain-containing protein [Hypoxylon rubiginosum]
MSSLFGNPNTTAQSNNATTSSAPAPGGLFGSSTPTSSGGLFGGSTGTPSFSFGNLGGSSTPAAGASSTTPTTGMFGNTGPKPESSPMFAGATKTPTTTAGGGGLFGGSQTPTSNLFGSAAKPAQSTNLFGNAGSTPASTGANTASSSATAGAPSGLFAQKTNNSSTPAITTTPAPQPGGLFAGNNGGPTLFAGVNTSHTPASNSASQSTTPSKPMFALNSTTPAGAPPSKPAPSMFSAGAPGGSLFPSQSGTQKDGQSASSLFANAGGSTQASTSTTNKPESSAPPSGASLFQNAGQPTNQSTSLFAGAKPAENSSAPGGFFGAKPATTPSGSTTPNTTTSLFGQQPAKPAEATSAKPNLFGGAGAGATAAMPTNASSLFSGAGNASSTPASAAASTNPATTQAGGFTLGGIKSSDAASTSDKPTPQTSMFNLGKPPAATATEQPKPTSNLFGNAASTTAPGTTSTAAPTLGLGSTTSTTTAPGTATPNTTAQGTNPLFGASKATPSTENVAAQPTGGANTLGASTAGPTSSMARLKNKTMDEIITRWATDLSKYQKEFKDQAAQVAQWDRLLVENGERIQKLYLETFEAEKGSREVERQLVGIESQQEELEAWLDKYESEVDVMFSKQIGHGEQLAGPDQEREKTYKLAEKITERLDDMGRDLTKMIKEINDISGSLSKGNKPDDPLSQIVRVLNGHLTQLQWIDTNAAALQAKVAAAQKQSSTVGNQYGGPEQDNVDSFYRSYMGRR